MPSITATPPVSSFFIGSALAAGAAHPLGGFWGMLAFAQALTVVGYLASSLPQWAGWIDGTVLQRLTILQGAVVAWFAGNVGYLLAVSNELSQIMCLLSAAAGGYGGDKFLMPLMQRIFGKTEKP